MEPGPRRWWRAEDSQHRAGGWLAQYDRMRRWHDRLRTADWSVPSVREERLDDAYAFFQNCFALRDWLFATGEVAKEVASGAVAESLALRLCRDLCNATKHFDLSRPSTLGFTIGRQYRAQPFVVFEDADGRQDLFEVVALADQCVAEWDAFLAARGLLEGPPRTSQGRSSP